MHRPSPATLLPAAPTNAPINTHTKASALPTSTRVARVVALTFACVAASAWLSAACGSSETPAADAAASPSPEALFRVIEPSLVNRCGAKDGVCHVNGVYNGAPRWLAQPDGYASIKAFRGILPLTRDADDSTLLTQAAHDGPGLASTPELKAKVREWIAAELGPGKLPATAPFVVETGANVIDLKDVDPALAGSTLEFVATVKGGVLTLSTLRLHAATTANVTVDSPFFVQLPKDARVKVDPKNAGFEGTLEVPAGVRRTFFGGELVLVNFNQDTRLKLVFTKVATTPGKGPVRDCTALDLFQSSAIPAMKTFLATVPDPQFDAGAPEAGTPTAACVSCHGGGEDQADAAAPGSLEFVATQAFDLRKLDSDPRAACAQSKQWIDFSNKEKSLLLTNPQGTGNELHPLKGVPSTHPVVEGLRTWIAAEQN